MASQCFHNLPFSGLLFCLSFDTLPFFLTPRLTYSWGKKMSPLLFFSTFKQGTPKWLVSGYHYTNVNCHYVGIISSIIWSIFFPFRFSPHPLIIGSLIIPFIRFSNLLFPPPKYFLQYLFSFFQRKYHFSFYLSVLSISLTGKEITFIQTLSALV